MAGGAIRVTGSNNRDWVIIGVPMADGGMGTGSEAGEVEFNPPPPGYGMPFKITAPAGYGQAGAHFGAVVLTGMINFDFDVDVVVGAPDFDTGGYVDRGRVFVFFGPWNPGANPPYSGFVVLDVDPSDPTGKARFGASIALGHLDSNQNQQDIVVGAPAGWVTYPSPAPKAEAGWVEIFLNVNTSPLTRYRDQRVQQDDAYLAEYNHYGSSVAIGSFKNNSYVTNMGDIAVGAPDTPVSGMVQAHFGHPDPGSGLPVWDSSPGNFQDVTGYSLASSSRFGTSLASDAYPYYFGPYYSRLAVGAPGALDAAGNPTGPNGSIHIYQGSATGLAGFVNPTDGILHATTGPPNYDTPHNLFGYSLAWSDNQGAGASYLLVGAPGATTGVIGGFEAGRVFHYAAAPGTVPATWPVDSFLDPTPNASERFGWAVACSNRGALTSLDDIIIGAPRSTISMSLFVDAGEVYVWNY
ncbi:MAG: hypothetical protein U1E76_26175 [Planctomycetota bacterium]